MADGVIALDEPAAFDKYLDTEELTVGANTVNRERMQIAGTGAADIAPVSAAGGLLVNLGSNNDVTLAVLPDTSGGDLAAIVAAVEGTLAVAGTVELGATDNAVLDAIAASVAAIDGDTSTIIGHVDGIEGLLGGTIAVSHAALTELAAAINSSKVDVNLVTSDVSIGGGVEYTEGDTDASITGKAILWEDTSDTLRSVSAAKPLPVDVKNTTLTVTGAGGTFPVTQSTSPWVVAGGGTAGAAAAAVLTIQGIAGMTKVLVTPDANSAVNVAQLAGTATAVNNGTVDNGTLRVTMASNSSGILAGVTTVTTVTTVGTLTGGGVASDSVLTANPITIGGRASTATPSAVSGDGDVVNHWLTRTGATVIDGAIVDDAAFTPGTSRVVAGGYFADEASTDSVDEGDLGAARMTLDRKVIVAPSPHTGGGLSVFRSLDLDEADQQIKGSPGQVYGWQWVNRTTAPLYVKFYNALAANVTVGTTTPVMTIELTADASDHIAANALGAMGIEFTTAITVACTTGLADNDTGAPGANACVVNIFYK